MTDNAETSPTPAPEAHNPIYVIGIRAAALLARLAEIAPKLKEAELRLAIHMADTCDQHYTLKASSRHLAAATGLARGKVQHAIDTLGARGFISTREGTGSKAAAYVLHFAAVIPFSGSLREPPSGRQEQPGFFTQPAKLYYESTDDRAPTPDFAAALDELPHRTRRAIELRAAHYPWRHIAQKLHVTTGAADSLVRRAFNRINKTLLNLPRYHQIGHPPPMKTKPHDPHAAVAAAQQPKVTRKLAHTIHPPPRDARGRIPKRAPAGELRTAPRIKPPHPLPY